MAANSEKIDITTIVTVLTTALVLRVAWGILVPVVPVADSNAYDVFARVLTEHGVYGWTPGEPSAYWPVGTSAIYAAIYSVFGIAYPPIVALNIALSTCIVGLTMWLGIMFFNQTTATIAGGLMAVWPSEVFYVTILASEIPFTLFVLLGFGAWFTSGLSNTTRALTTGLALGAASYIRPVALLLPLIFWLSTLPNWHRARERFVVMILATAVIALMIAPWSARNTKLFGHLVLLSTNGGTNLWMGNNPESTGFYMPLPTATDSLDEYTRDTILGEQAKQYIKEYPVSFVMRTIQKAVMLHAGETIAVHWNVEGIRYRFGEPL